MSKLCIIFRLTLIYGSLCLAGCSALKKTTASDAKVTMQDQKETEAQQSALRNTQKETNVLTYYPDGTVHQFQHITEEMAQVQSGLLKTNEKKVLKSEDSSKKSVPDYRWVIAAVFVLFIGVGWLYLRFKISI